MKPEQAIDENYKWMQCCRVGLNVEEVANHLQGFIDAKRHIAELWFRSDIPAEKQQLVQFMKMHEDRMAEILGMRSSFIQNP